MRVAVYPGSFNPLHIGHEAIVRHLTCDRAFDCVYLVISPQNPFKDPSNVKTARDRYNAAVEAVRRHPDLRVKVDGIELGMEPPHYTIRTLDALRGREPGNSFTLIMGGDCLSELRGWRDYGRILLEYGIAVFPREGYDSQGLRNSLLEENPLYRIELLEDRLVNISSTQIREAAARGEDVKRLLM